MTVNQHNSTHPIFKFNASMSQPLLSRIKWEGFLVNEMKINAANFTTRLMEIIKKTFGIGDIIF